MRYVERALRTETICRQNLYETLFLIGLEYSCGRNKVSFKIVLQFSQQSLRISKRNFTNQHI